MDKTVVIYLIQEEITYDDLKQPVKVEIGKRKAYAQRRSISRAEWFDAGRVGMNPVIAFSLPFFDYKNESTVEYEGKRYGVYRTYESNRGNNIEIYCEEKGGVHE